ALALGCGGAEAEPPPTLEFETQPSCAAADASCLNADTTTLDVDGVRVIHKRLPGHPLVAFRIGFDAPAGSSYQRWAETLAFTLYEFGGPSWMSAAEWDAEQLRLGANVNASNGLDYGTISASVPAANWLEMWALTIEGISAHRNYTWELANMLDVYRRSFESERDDPDAAASIDAWSRLFDAQPYNYQREHAEVLTLMSTLDIDGAWDTLSAGERWLVTVVGDVSVDEVRSAVSNGLGRVGLHSPTWLFGPDAAPEPANIPSIRVLAYPEAPTWYIRGFFKGPSGSSPDFAALQLGVKVLDQRLFQEVRDVRGLAYTTGASLSFYRESFGSVWITSESPLEALEVSRSVLADLKAQGPTEAELAAARRSLLTELLSDSDTPSGIASTLADWELTAGSREALDDYLAGLEQTTPQQVASVLDTYLRNEQIAAAGGGSELSILDLQGWLVSP
ncbi:MAG TPA: insulinase family protein, partial [Polyangiaceae bacterium]|nr:insulinase family protein [Polyangiaceae bacterium]